MNAAVPASGGQPRESRAAHPGSVPSTTERPWSTPVGSSEADGLIDWTVVSRQVGAALAAASGLAVLGTVAGVVAGSPLGAAAGRWSGIGGLVFALTAVGLVAFSALRGVARVGDRGERLAGRDVGMLPPQVRRSCSSPNRDTRP